MEDDRDRSVLAEKLGKKLLGAVLFVLGWLHTAVNSIGEWYTVNVLGTAEEITKSVVRGVFATGARYVHQFSAFILAVFRGDSYKAKTRRERAARSQAWDSWLLRSRGTFNAIVEQELTPGMNANQSPADGDASQQIRVNFPNRANTSNKSKKKIRNAKRWRLWQRVPSAHELATISSKLFVQVSAPALSTQRRGLLEDARLAVEVGIGKVFAFFRTATRKIFLISSTHHSSSGFSELMNEKNLYGTLYGSMQTRQWENLHILTASDAILRAGYPLEEHSVTTCDGYVLQMHRIPRRGARDVAFFQHGVLDTSLGWVAGGTGRSAALEAYDAGFDVWLANTRSNPPRLNINPAKQGARYWNYSANELALCDITAQIDHIHGIKMMELVGDKSFSGKKGSVDLHGRLATAYMENNTASEAISNNIDKVHSFPIRDLERLCFKGGDTIKNRMIDGELFLRRTQSSPRLTLQAVHDQDTDHSCPPVPSDRSRNNDDDMDPTDRSSSSPCYMSAEEEPSSPTIDQNPAVPYRLQAVGHSLGAACLLMYAVGCSMQRRPHRLSRLILLSPAGFHPCIPLGVRPLKWITPFMVWFFDTFFPGRGFGLRLPSPLLRWITFKLMADVRRSPALLDLVKAGFSVATSGDKSEWHAAMELPHYSAMSMPCVSVHTAGSFSQWARYGNFRFYDYGSKKKNREHYGSNEPPSVAKNYWRLQGVPVDLAAGTSDGLIPPRSVYYHYTRLKDAGVECSFREYDYGHLDFTFGITEDVVRYILGRLKKSSTNFLVADHH